MPLFFFHIMSPNERIEDVEGLELPDADAARREAILSLRSIISHEIRHGILSLDEWIEVEDSDRKPLLLVRIGDALAIATSHRSKEAIVSILPPLS